METEKRQIIFFLGTNNIIHTAPLDAYEPGDIVETKEALAKKLRCSPDEIKVKITGVKSGKKSKGRSLSIHLIDINALKTYFK